MWELIKQILSSPFGSFASVLGTLLFLFWVAVRSGRIIEKFTIVNKLESSVEKIKEDMSIVKAFIEVDQRNNNPFAQRQSPINLNDKGIQVNKDLGADAIINKYWSEVNAIIKGKLNKIDSSNPYTIQEICFEIGQTYSQYFDKHDMEKIKTVAYNEGFDLSSFDLVFGIGIRNRYFSENGMNIEDVDKHDPHKNDTDK